MPGQVMVVIGDRQWTVVVASTPAELTSGLSGVGSIPAQTGVLFDLACDYRTIQIDMSRMLFALDIVFINSTRGVVGVMHNVQPGDTDVRFENVNLSGARWFLEVNAGEAEGINVGDNVVIQGSTAPTQLDLTGILNFAVTMMMVVFVGRMAIKAVSPPKPRPELYGPRGERLLSQNLPQTSIEGGEVIPPQYRHLVDPLPVPEFALSLEYLPAVELEPGETRTDALLRKLKDGVGRIQSSPEFRNYLIAMSRFHNYSWNNQLLIMMQRPDATRVAGFNTWRDLGRWVRKGETGIAIFAPSFRSADVTWVRHADGMRWRIQRTGQEWGIYREGRLVERHRTKRAADRRLRAWGATEERVAEAEPRFLVVYVFDIAQTEGKPLPEFQVPVLTGEVNEELFARLRALMKQRGVNVSFEPRPYQAPEVKGQYLAPNEIWVRPEEPPAQQLKTLLHESAHYYSEGVFRIPKRDAETIAESAAFVVGAHHGFDTGVRSFPYVALWAQDEKVLAENLGGIQCVANTILEELGEAGEKEGFSPQAMPSVGVMPRLPPEAYKDVLFREYIRDLVRLGETITDEEARVMWQTWKKRQELPYLAQTAPGTELRFADRPQTITSDTLRGWLREERARPIQTAGWYGAEGYKPRLYVIGETIYQIEWGPARKHLLLPASEEDMAHDTRERLREEGVEIGPPGKPPPGKPTRGDVTVGARQKLGVWIIDNRTGVTLAEWTDKDARGLFEEGSFRGRVPVSVWEAADKELTESVLGYAESVGLLAKGSPVSYLPQAERGKYSWLIIDPETGEIMIKPGYTTVSKAQRAARDFAIRRAKYAGEHPVTLRIYDREPDIGELDEGMVFEGRILLPEGRIVDSKGEAPAVIPTEPGRPRPGKEELEYLADSPEFLTQTIDATGYRERIDTAFQEAIRRAKGAK